MIVLSVDLPKYTIPPPSITDASVSLPTSNKVKLREDEEAAEAGERDNPDS